jgi:hypothetical protein
VPSPANAIEIALAAGERARRKLRELGIDPGRCPRLVCALEDAVGGLIAAGELGWPIEPRRVYLDEVRRRLEDEPLLDDPPEPPMRSSLRLHKELNAARTARL